MKKSFVIAVAVIMAIAAVAYTIKAAERKTTRITYGYVAGTKGNNENQLILEDLFKVINKKYKVDIKIVVFKDIESIKKQIKSGKVDIFQCWNTDCDYEFYKSSEFTPFFASTSLGFSKINMCIITKKKDKIKSINEIKGRKMIFSGDAFSYYNLRKMIGSPPEDFFSSLVIKNDGASNVYSVAMDVSDVAFVDTYTLKSFEIINPGPVKKTESLVCSELFKWSAFYSSGKMDSGLKKKMTKDFTKIFSNPRKAVKSGEFKEFRPFFDKYLPLILQVKFKPMAVVSEDYKNVYLLFKDAESKGWDKDYKRWHKIADTNN